MFSNNFKRGGGGGGVTLNLRDSNFKELIGFERKIIKESSFGTKVT